MEVYRQKSKSNYVVAPSREAVDIIQEISSKLNDYVVSSEVLSNLIGGLGVGKIIENVAKDKRKQEIILEALTEYFRRYLGSYRMQIWKGKRARGYVCDGLRVSDGRREMLYVLWVRFTPLYTIMDEQKLLRRLGVITIKKGKIIKPQMDVKVVLVYPESVSMMSVASLKNVVGFPLKREVIHALLAIKGESFGGYGDYDYYRALLDRELRDQIQYVMMYLR